MITLKQLAKELNLSVSTVSKALNDSDEISDQTIQRVKEAAALRNYKPNKIASSLRTNRTKTIGVIIPDILNPFFANVLLGIEKEASLLGYNVITSISNETLKQEVTAMQFLADGSVDGFLVSVSRETQEKNEITHFQQILSEGYGLVMFDRTLASVSCDKVIIDDFGTVYKSVNYLLDQGAKNIAFFSSIDHLKIGKRRKQGYLKACEDREAKSTSVLCLRESTSYQQQIRKFLNTHPQTDAIFAADNTLGTIAVNMAVNLGIRVPDDISVIGFAGDETAVFSVPTLTTIDQGAEAMGAKAVRMLIGRLQKLHKKKNLDPVIETLETSLVKRGSSL